MNFKYKTFSPSQKARIDRLYEKQVEKSVNDGLMVQLVENFLAVVSETLHDEFGFGEVRLNRFKDRLEKKLECINDDSVNWDDIVKCMNVQRLAVVNCQVVKLSDLAKGKIKRKVG